MNKLLSVLFVLFLGVFSLLRPATLQPESHLRSQIIRQSFSPISAAGSQEEGGAVQGAAYLYDPVSPLVVNFTGVDPNAQHTDSMYERWLRGEIDLDENESILSAAEVAHLQALAMRMGETSGVQIAQHGPGLTAPVPGGVSFDSIDFTSSGGWVPPDPEMAVGPDHIIVVVNVAVVIYDKEGNTTLGPVPAGSLFSGPSCTSGLFDPNVLYDEEEDRFIIAFAQGAYSSTGGYCLLASQTGDPLGLWNEYFFPLSSSAGWLDYPHAGVGDNFIFMGGNIYTLGGYFIEGRIYAFNKEGLYSGAPITTIALGLSYSYDTPQPVNLHGASTGTWPEWGDSHYFLSEPYNGIHYTLFEWDTVTLINHGNLSIGTGGYPVHVPQSGGYNLNPIDWRPLDFEYRNGYGWMTATNACNPGGGTVNCLLWAQIDLNSASLGPAGSGIYASPGEHRFFPDLAVNHCNDMVLGYTKSSPSMYPSVYVTGREVGDSYGQLQAEIEVKAGEITYTAYDLPPLRWGDYTGMTIDPDGLTFWYLGEYSKDTGTTNARWGNYISSFTYPNCTIDQNASISLEMTVGTESDCEEIFTDEITVEIGTEVNYCYTVTNNGDVLLDLHDLFDSDLGPLLEAYSYSLPPGGSTVITVSSTILETTTNTATWTAYNGSGTATAVSADSATVNVLIPEITASFPDGALSQFELTIEEYLLNITNQGEGALGWLVYTAEFSAEPETMSACSVPVEISWLSIDPASGSIPAGSSSEVTVTVDTTELEAAASYAASICVSSNDPEFPMLEFPVDLTVIPYIYSLMLSEGMSVSGEVGTSVVYEVRLTSTGNITAAYDLVATSAWSADLSDDTVFLDAGGSTTVYVTVDIPLNAIDGAVSAVILTATSQNNPGVSASVTLTTTAVVPMKNIYLPFVRKP
jgi:hypothetical protein